MIDKIHCEVINACIRGTVGPQNPRDKQINTSIFMKKHLALTFAILSLASFTSKAVGLVNPSFELPAIPSPNPWIGLSGSPAGFGWVIPSGNVEVISSTLWSPSHGNQSLDLNGDQPGTIYQDFTFPSAGLWAIKFDMSANPGDINIQSNNKTLRVDFGAASGPLTGLSTNTVSNIGRSHFDMQYVEITSPTLSVDASTIYRLKFTSLTGDTGGPVIDNVRIVAVPEPNSLAMLALTIGCFALSKRKGWPQTRPSHGT